MKTACKAAQAYAPLMGRLLIANLFLVSGFKKIPGFANTAGYMASKMPSLDPDVISVLLALTIIVEIGAGLMVLVGWQARWGATLLFLWMIPVTYLFHAYWGLPPDPMQAQFIQFHKNLAIMGGLLMIIGLGSGPYSLGKKDNC